MGKGTEKVEGGLGSGDPPVWSSKETVGQKEMGVGEVIAGGEAEMEYCQGAGMGKDGRISNSGFIGLVKKFTWVFP